MTTRTTRTIVLAAVVALGVAGCGGGSGDGEKGGDGDERALGPLDQFWEQAYGDWDEDESVRQANRVEEIVAECMAEQGFDYTPVDQSQWMGEVTEMDELDVEWGTLEFAEQYGYGFTTDPYGYEDDDAVDPGQEYVDPNEDYVAAMSEGEQEAYYAALWGEPQDGELDPEAEWDWTTGGCQGKAQHEVFEGGEASTEFADLEDEMTALWEAVEADPRLAELNAAWASCMADAGHAGYAAVGDAENEISEAMNAIWEEGLPTVEGDGTEFDAEAWEAQEAAVQEKMKDLTPREIELAVADFTCREEIDYEDQRVAVDHDHQQRFVDEHRAELEAWAEAMQSSRS